MNILCSTASVVVEIFASQRQFGWPIARVVWREHAVKINRFAAPRGWRTVRVSLFADGLFTLEHKRFVLKIYCGGPPSGELPSQRVRIAASAPLIRPPWSVQPR